MRELTSNEAESVNVDAKSETSSTTFPYAGCPQEAEF